MRFIGLGRTALGDDGCTHFWCALFPSHGNLIFVTLNHNQISDEGAFLGCGLKRNFPLKFIDLSDNHITSVGAKTICRGLQSRRERGSPLQRMWMGGNPLSRDDIAECMVLATPGYDNTPDFISQYLQTSEGERCTCRQGS